MCDNTQPGFLVVIEQAVDNLSAYVPDIPGCVATGVDYDQVVANIHRSYEAMMELLPFEERTIIKPTSSYAIITPQRFL